MSDPNTHISTDSVENIAELFEHIGESEWRVGGEFDVRAGAGWMVVENITLVRRATDGGQDG